MCCTWQLYGTAFLLPVSITFAAFHGGFSPSSRTVIVLNDAKPVLRTFSVTGRIFVFERTVTRQDSLHAKRCVHVIMLYSLHSLHEVDCMRC